MGSVLVVQRVVYVEVDIDGWNEVFGLSTQ